MKSAARWIPAVTIGISAAFLLAACDSGSTSTTPSGAATATSGSTSAAAAARPEPTNIPTTCTPSQGGSNGKLLIGMVGITTQGSFFGQVDQGMQDVADKAGVELQLVDGKIDAQVQADAVDNLITKGANAIIVDPLNADALSPVIKRAVDAGIPVVAFDGTIEGDADISTFVGISNSEGGKQIGKALVDITKGKGKVGEITALNSSIQIERQKAFEDTVKAAGMTIGTVVDGGNQADKAQAAAENLFTGNPDLEYVYATGQPALTGAVAAARSQNATDRVKIVGWDLAPESAQGLKDGFVKAVLQQDTFQMGYDSMKAAITVACGGTVDSTIPVATHVVTAANLDQFSYFLGE